MVDLLYLALAFGFFVLSWGLVRVLERLEGAGS
jgi:hypothetical protein